MKIRLAVTVDVDPAVWAEEYGCEREEVRADVRRYFETQIGQAQAIEDAALTVRIA